MIRILYVVPSRKKEKTPIIPDPSCGSSSSNRSSTCSGRTDGGNTDSSAVAAKKEEREKETPQRPLQLVARSIATKLHHTAATSNSVQLYNVHTNNTTDISIRTPSTAEVVPHQTMNTKNTNHDDDNNNEESFHDVAIGTGTNERRKKNHQSRDHFKKKSNQKAAS